MKRTKIFYQMASHGIVSNLMLIALLFFSFSCSKEEDENQIIFAYDTLEYALDYPYVFKGQYITTPNYYSNIEDVQFEILEQFPENALSINPSNGNIEIADPALFDVNLTEEISATVRIYKNDVSDYSKIIVEVIESNRYWGTSHLHQNLLLDLAYRDDNIEESEKFEVRVAEYTFSIAKDETITEINHFFGEWQDVAYTIEIFDDKRENVYSFRYEVTTATSSIATFFWPLELKANALYTIRRTSDTPQISKPVHTVDGSKMSFPFTQSTVTYHGSNFYNEDEFVNKDQGIPQLFFGYEDHEQLKLNMKNQYKNYDRFVSK